MSSFEENHAAWIDGRLDPAEESSFLAELERRGMGVSEKDELRKLGGLLRKHGAAPALKNADFFNHQILERIRVEEPTPKEERPRHTAGSGWLWRMGLGGAICLLAAAALYRVTVPHTPGPVPEAHEYIAQILDAEPGEGVTAVTYQAPKSDMTVLWLEGLDYVPKISPEPTPTAK